MVYEMWKNVEGGWKYDTKCINGASVSFFFNDTATTEIYTLSLHDALPISKIARKVAEGVIHCAMALQVAAMRCEK